MAGKSKVPREKVELVVSEYLAGKRAGEVSKAHRVNRKTVLLWVKRLGHEVRPQEEDAGAPKRPPSNTQEKTIIEMRQAGKSQQKIGSALGFSQCTISRVLRKSGMPTKLRLQGKEHPAWRGGLLKANGYIQEYVSMNDPMYSMANSQGYCAQHRLVVARAFGRPLSEHESVHHVNGSKTDNRLENLQLRQGKHGTGIVMRCGCCGSTKVVATRLAD
jgi:hypothetical protein